MVQEAEDGGPGSHDVQARKHQFFRVGVHGGADTGLDADFSAYWNDAMDEASL